MNNKLVSAAAWQASTNCYPKKGGETPEAHYGAAFLHKQAAETTDDEDDRAQHLIMASFHRKKSGMPDEAAGQADAAAVSNSREAAERARLRYDQQFQQEVERTGDPIAAARNIKLLHPELLTALSKSAAALANEKLPARLAPSAPLPMPTPENLDAMGLNRGISFEHFCAAWKANGSKAEPLDAQKVFDALVDQLSLARTDRGAAETQTAAAHPALAAKCGIRVVSPSAPAVPPLPAGQARISWNPFQLGAAGQARKP